MSIIFRPDSVPETGGDVGDDVPHRHQGHAHHSLEDDHKEYPDKPYLPEEGALSVLVLALRRIVEARVSTHLGLASGVGGHLTPVQISGVKIAQGEVDIASEVTSLTVHSAVDKLGDEVAGDGDDEGVGDDGHPGEGAHDVQPDADIPSVLRNRSPISHKQLLCIQPRKIKSVFKIYT